MPQDALATGRALDLRLQIPALVAWAGLAVLLYRSVLTVTVTAVLSAVIAVTALILGRRRPADATGRTSGYQITALTGCCVAVVLGSAAGHAAIRTAGPIPDLADQRAVVRIEARVVTEPRIVERVAPEGETSTLVVLRADVAVVEARGQRSNVRTPVLIFTEPSEALATLQWRSEFTATGRLSPSGPASDVVATFVPVGELQVSTGRGDVFTAADWSMGRLQAIWRRSSARSGTSLDPVDAPAHELGVAAQALFDPGEGRT